MTFQKTSLALLLALPLAATAADSPPPPEPAGFIPGIPVLQVAKEVYLPQAKAENPSPAPTVSPSAAKKMRKEDFPEIAPFDIPGQTKKPVVQNECSDFTPAKNALDAMAQLYHHMEYKCLRDPNANNLEALLGIPVINVYVGGKYRDFVKVVDDYPGKFYLVQFVDDSGEISMIEFEISKLFLENGGNLFEERYFPPIIPRPEIKPNLDDARHSWIYDKYNATFPSSFFGDYSPSSVHVWAKGDMALVIKSRSIAGAEKAYIRFY